MAKSRLALILALVLLTVAVFGGDVWTTRAYAYTNLGKTATASNVYNNSATYAAGKAIDGDPATRWATNNAASYWLQVELNQRSTIHQVVMNEYQSRITAYTIEVSDDGATWVTAKTGTKVAGTTHTITTVNLTTPATGRFVRLSISAASAGPSLYELEVLGEPALDTNLSLDKTATASNVYNNNANYAAARATDGDPATRWATNNDSSYWLQVDLGQASVISQAVLNEYQSRITSYAIEISDDGATWVTAKTGSKTASATNTVTTVNLAKPVTARYVRLSIDATSSGPSLYSFDVFGRLPTELYAATASQLTDAMAAAAPGDTIVMRNGTWNNLVIRFSANATAAHPVALRAETPGQVTISGQSGLSLDSPHLIVDGLKFTNGYAATGLDSVIRFSSSYGRVTNTAIINFNPPSSATKYYWVFFNGGHNRLDNSYLEGKNHNQPVVGNQNTGIEKYNQVDHSYFKNIQNVVANGMETFRIWGYGGGGEEGTDGAYFTIDSNLFEHADGDDEIISLKSNHNTVTNNTIRESRGGIVARSGHWNKIERNFILQNNYPLSSGIRVTGHDVTVANNYVSGVASSALWLTTGEYVFDSNHQLHYLTPNFVPLASATAPYGYVGHYAQVKNGKFVHNTFVNNGGTDINVGIMYKNHWPEYQMVLLPENNTIANNLIYKTAGGVGISTQAQDKAAPLNGFTFSPNTFAGNRLYNATASIKAPNNTSAGYTTGTLASAKLSLSGELYRPDAGSTAIDAGVGTYVPDDMDGQTRSGTHDVGADEVTSGSVTNRPLTAADVGPLWMR